MSYVGISAGFHDAAIAVVGSNGEIKFAAHSERYSKIKSDHAIDSGLLADAMNYIDSGSSFNYYEKPILKWLRQIRAGENPQLKNLAVKNILGREFYKTTGAKNVKTHSHHLCHAAAGFQTSPFDRATVVVIDAIGEFECITVWGAEYNANGAATYKKLWSKKYPDSIGLFYSALTQRVGLRPLDEEYILMGMSGWGKATHLEHLRMELLHDTNNLDFTRNLHSGVEDDLLIGADSMDIAASTQALAEELIYAVMAKANSYSWSDNLVYMGGVALNCLANRNLGKWFNNIWIMPNPGDAGSSLGAAALAYQRKLEWTNAYLGHPIVGQYPVEELIRELLTNRIVGVASGRAEFGPRALGNRSLLADPRGEDIKDRVNDIKRRQKFRPFAPVILQEWADTYFKMPSGWVDSRYMQIVAECRSPALFPAIVHVDGTSRIQTVPNDGSGIRTLLEEWYKKTGCPMLLNTSLNIRGEPMVNDRADADRFQQIYGVRVIS